MSKGSSQNDGGLNIRVVTGHERHVVLFFESVIEKLNCQLNIRPFFFSLNNRNCVGPQHLQGVAGCRSADSQFRATYPWGHA